MKRCLAYQEALTADEIALIARKHNIDVNDFCRLTESQVTSSHDLKDTTFVVSQTGVRYRDVTDHELSLLFPEEANVVTECMRYRLSFPCTPVELVAFVNGTGAFDLPDGFYELVSGVPVRRANETPDDRALRLYKMRCAGMSGSDIASVETLASGSAMSKSRANKLCQKGSALVAAKARAATTMTGQMNAIGVVGKRPKTKAG